MHTEPNLRTMINELYEPDVPVYLTAKEINGKLDMLKNKVADEPDIIQNQFWDIMRHFNVEYHDNPIMSPTHWFTGQHEPLEFATYEQIINEMYRTIYYQKYEF